MSINESKTQPTLGADDPFHPREGKTLTWTGVNMQVVSIVYRIPYVCYGVYALLRIRYCIPCTLILYIEHGASLIIVFQRTFRELKLTRSLTCHVKSCHAMPCLFHVLSIVTL